MKLKTKLTRIAALIAAEAERNPEFGAKLEELLGGGSKIPASSSSAAKKRKPPAAGERSTLHRGRRSPAALDPVALARDSEATLRAKLAELDHERLLDVVAEFGMDPGKLVMKGRTTPES